MKLKILYQSEELVAVFKPSGLLVHRTKLDASESTFALQLVRNQVRRHVFPLHRLDKATSGVLVFATSAEAASKYGKLFQNGDIDKTYLAIVRGIPQQKEWRVDYSLDEKPSTTAFRLLHSIKIQEPVGKYQEAWYSMLEAKPQTGRLHQVRRHLKHCSHPIIGDVNYGKGVHNRYFADRFALKRLYLFCSRMRLHDVVIEAPMDADFQNIIQEFGWTK